MKTKKIEVNVEWNEQGGFSADVQQLGVFTFADTLPELQANILEALNLHFEESGRTVTGGDVELGLKLATFFKHHNVLNAQTLAKRIGMKPAQLSQYVNNVKKPSEKQLNRILEGIHGIGRELLQVQFTL